MANTTKGNKDSTRSKANPKNAKKVKSATNPAAPVVQSQAASAATPAVPVVPSAPAPSALSVPAKPSEIIDPVKLSERLDNVTKNIRNEIERMNKSFVRIGYELYKVRDGKLYLGQDFKNVYEYGEKVLGFQKSSVASYISVCERFSVLKDEKPTAKLNSDYENFTYGQLSLMLSLPSEKLSEITPEKTCKEIREIKKTVKVEKELKSASKASASPASPAPVPAPAAPAASPSKASNLTVYIVSWLYRGDSFKSATIQLSDDTSESLHKEIMVLFKNDWFDFGRDGDSLSINLAGGSK